MENVLTVKRELIAEFIPEKGITTENCDIMVDIILKNYEFLARPEAENDPSHKQIIPYVVLCRGEEVFATRRLKKGNEARLHGLLSVGIGGHINPETDGSGEDVLSRGMNRELEEEVYIESRGKMTPCGIINDDTTEVGSVHLGLFFTLEVTGEVRVLETEKLEGFWIKRSDMPGLSETMETWSQFVTLALSK
ncbi:MAG: NUDIX domain-containing protein [Clostridia bacterium]|nr:NUDIX domain-containing protein [Clostridia bacterium]